MAKPKKQLRLFGKPLPVRSAKDLEELKRKQGVIGKCRAEKLLGLGRDLWESDEDFEKFLKIINDMRKEGRASDAKSSNRPKKTKSVRK